MDFMVNLDIRKLPQPISYGDRILLTGSCFTEHIGNGLRELKFSTLQNPNGILFDPASVCKSLISYVQNRQYTESDLFSLNEVWNSWDHHSRFSHIDAKMALKQINDSQAEAHAFLRRADWIIITLGSSFSYRLGPAAELYRPASNSPLSSIQGDTGVANCHRAPAKWFNKHLLEVTETIELLDNCYHQLIDHNPNLKIIFTISPVRHLRDGVVDNNRSKARLIEAVHHMVNKFEGLYYFPAYELVIDVLRDYRFYDIDMTHPNYLATDFVMEKFAGSCIDSASQELMQEVRKIMIARKHRAFQPETNAHRAFLKEHYNKAKMLMDKYPLLDFSEEMSYFSESSKL